MTTEITGAAPEQGRRRRLGEWLSLAIVVYLVTSIPYALAYWKAPADLSFTGTLMWRQDQDAYFSFIRQAAEGRWLWINRFTDVLHHPIYFNLEWFLVGRVMGLLDSVWAYHLWRCAGALSIGAGFFFLTEVTLSSVRLRRMAMGLALFGGGFGTLCWLLNLAGQAVAASTGVHLKTLPTQFAFLGTSPFAQILLNPHFALPLGLFLSAMAAFIQGERTGRRRWYTWAGALAILEALMRPYELMVLYVALPLFALGETLVARKIDWHRIWQRFLPLGMVAPVFLYNLYIFKFHPVFKYWGSQGVDPYQPLLSTFVLIGPAGVLFALRLCLIRKYPLQSAPDRLLLVWLGTVLFFLQAGAIPMWRFVPYSPQLHTSLMPPIILLGVVVLDSQRWPLRTRHPALAGGLVAAIVILSTVDSFESVRSYSKSPPSEISDGYFPTHDLEAYRWLDREGRPDDVVCCSLETGHRITRYAAVRVVLGHWSVTPHYASLKAEIEQFYGGKMSPAAVTNFLREHRVKWIYLGPSEHLLGVSGLDAMTGLQKRIVNNDVTVYEVIDPGK